MLRIDHTVLADALVSPGKLALGEIESGGTSEQLLTIRLRPSPFHTGVANRRVTYHLGHLPALGTGSNTFTPAFYAAFATVAFSATDFTLGGPDKAFIVKVTFTPPAPRSDNRLFGGYITLTPDDGSPTLSVPYGGYNGDYQEIQALKPTANGFPWLAKLTGTTFTKQTDGATFTLQGSDVPNFLVHLDHQVRQLQFEVFDVANNRSVGLGYVQDYLPRNSSATGFFAFTWDGTVFAKAGLVPKPLPNGTYQIDLSTLKALGDKDNPAHFERWLSPTIVIARPPAP